jgi:uncharacterized membrane-anchored protein YjiN (DUF445 family)
MKKPKKSELAEIQRIQRGIPKELTDNLMRKIKVSPTISKVLREAVQSPEMDDKKREMMQNFIDTGAVDQTEMVENQTTVKKIKEYLDQEFAKSVLAGRLPEPKNEKVLKKYRKICLKLTKKST